MFNEINLFLLYSYRRARRWVILIVGLSVLLVGIAMLVLPGPAVVVIPAGLAILATEFAWAARLLIQLKQRFTKIREMVLAGSVANPDDVIPDKKDAANK